MRNDRLKKTFCAIGIAALLIIAYYCRSLHLLPDNPFVRVVMTTARSLIQVSLIVMWCISLYHRLINLSVRNYMIAVGMLLAFWLTIRTCKWDFSVDTTHAIGRYCWYSFYIPMVLIPLFGVFIADHIGKSETHKTPKWMRYLYIPAALMILAVFTNDWHRLAFSFPKGIDQYEKHYQHEIVYFVIMAWFVILGFYFVFTLIRKSRVPSGKGFQKLPAVIMAGAVLFWTLYCLKLIKCDLTVVDCLIITLLLESAIQSRLIPSNTNYHVFFRSSTVAAQIVDFSFRPCVLSSAASEFPEDVLRRACMEPTELGDTILHGKAIRGGYVFWQDDVRQMTVLAQKLRETQSCLSEKNEMLRSELELAEQRARTEEMVRLYDRIADEVSDQLAKIEMLLQSAENGHADVREALAEIAVISAYVKRRGNLFLLSEYGNRIQAKELEYCIRESLDHLKSGGIFASLDSSCDGEFSLEHTVAIYDFYEKIIEELFDGITAVLVHLSCKNGELFMRLQIGCRHDINDEFLRMLIAPMGQIRYQIQESDLSLDLTFSEGGVDQT